LSAKQVLSSLVVITEVKVELGVIGWKGADRRSQAPVREQPVELRFNLKLLAKWNELTLVLVQENIDIRILVGLSDQEVTLFVEFTDHCDTLIEVMELFSVSSLEVISVVGLPTFPVILLFYLTARKRVETSSK